MQHQMLKVKSLWCHARQPVTCFSFVTCFTHTKQKTRTLPSTLPSLIFVNQGSKSFLDDSLTPGQTISHTKLLFYSFLSRGVCCSEPARGPEEAVLRAAGPAWGSGPGPQPAAGPTQGAPGETAAGQRRRDLRAERCSSHAVACRKKKNPKKTINNQMKEIVPISSWASRGEVMFFVSTFWSKLETTRMVK